MKEFYQKILEKELKGLPENFIVAISTKNENHFDVNKSLVKYLTGKGNTGVYVTANIPYLSLFKELQKEKINTKKMHFIDMIKDTGCGKKNCICLQGPTDLTNLSIAISKFTEENPEKKFLLLDSFSTLLIYNNLTDLVKFTHSLLTKLRLTGTIGVIVSLEDDLNKKIAGTITQFCDKLIRVE